MPTFSIVGSELKINWTGVLARFLGLNVSARFIILGHVAGAKLLVVRFGLVESSLRTGFRRGRKKKIGECETEE